MSKDELMQAGDVAPSAWPALGFESLEWIPSIDPALVPRSVRTGHQGQYRAAVVPAISDRDLVLPGQTLSLADEATATIARFDAELGAEIAPFASILLRLESASSSMIENLSSGAKAIAVAELGSDEKRNASEIVGNVRAMQAAIQLADQLDESAILAMHAALMGGLHPAIAGKWRTGQVWIGGDNYGPHGASFVAPHHRHVPAAIADLIAFARRDDLPVLAQAAVAHAQFETIHPFPDGNGRTGRALLHSMLRSKGLTHNVTVPVSAGLLTEPQRYFDALTAYREGDPSAIVEDLANASFAAIRNGRKLVDEIHNVRGAWSDAIRVRRDAAAWRLAELALRQPVFDAELVARELGIPAFSARTAIDTLAKAGVVTEFTGFKRNRMWQARDVLDALDGFAVRAGRKLSGDCSG